MRTILLVMLVSIFSLADTIRPIHGEEALTLENVTSPGANSAQEPLADSFSLDKAVHFLDSASLDWVKKRKCFTCHTNYHYLLARPAISADAEAHRQIRSALEQLVQQRWAEKGPRWDAEVIMSAAILALNDAATTGKLHEATRTALDRIWTVQREDGGFNWLKCNWPPFESDDHYGATIAAIGVGAAPQDYAQSETAQAGLEKIRQYLRGNPPPELHNMAMLMWASTYVAGLMTDAERQAGADQLLALQQPDGGWGLGSLGNWKRANGKEQQKNVSDGYGTGFVIYVLRRCGVPADNGQIQKGIAWLHSHQRASGRWFTRSMKKDNKHFITHAGTAFAILALAECQQMKPVVAEP